MTFSAKSMHLLGGWVPGNESSTTKGGGESGRFHLSDVFHTLMRCVELREAS